MVEFALVVPILCLVLFGVLQFGALYNNYVTLTDATRVGARKAAVSRHIANPAGAAESAARNSASGLAAGKLVITVASSWKQGDPVTVEASYPYSIKLVGLGIRSGSLKSKTTERVE